MTMNEMYRLLQQANYLAHATREEVLFDEAVIKVLGYWPDWYNMTLQ